MKEFFNKWGRRILGGGQPDEEQSRASGSTAQPGTEKGQTTGSAKTNPGEARRGKDPARGEESKIEWDSRQRRLVVETKRVLEKESISKFMFELSEGEVHVVGTDEVQQPELTITKSVYADSEPEARRFYDQNGSGVNVSAGPKSLYVKGESSSDVVSGGSGSVKIEGRSGSVVIVDSDIRGNIVNIVNGGTDGGTVIINRNGQQTGSSQSASRGETQVVLKVPVANKGEKSEPEYIIEVGSGSIIFKNVAGKYDISLNTGNIKVTDGRFIGESTVTTKAGNISVKFGRGQGKIKVQTSSGGGAIQETIFFEGVENPNGQTAILRLTAKAGKIEVNE